MVRRDAAAADLDLPTSRTIRTTDRTPSATDHVEDQTDRLENQKVREVLEKDRMFNLPGVKVERKVRCEILQPRFSIQKSLEKEETFRFFDQKARGEEHPELLQNQPSRFSNLEDRLLERKVRDSILQSREEEQEDRFSIQTDRF